MGAVVCVQHVTVVARGFFLFVRHVPSPLPCPVRDISYQQQPRGLVINARPHSRRNATAHGTAEK